MDILRRSLEQLSAPICTTCNVEMSWSRSVLIAAEQAIEHMFVCPRSDRVGETKTNMQAPKE
jgi:hypothetical protein